MFLPGIDSLFLVPVFVIKRRLLKNSEWKMKKTMRKNRLKGEKRNEFLMKGISFAGSKENENN